MSIWTLDRGWAIRAARPAGGVLCDIGCASFWYAAALQTFFRPDSIVGVEVEGHRLFRDGRRGSTMRPAIWRLPTPILVATIPHRCRPTSSPPGFRS